MGSAGWIMNSDQASFGTTRSDGMVQHPARKRTDLMVYQIRQKDGTGPFFQRNDHLPDGKQQHLPLKEFPDRSS